MPSVAGHFADRLFEAIDAKAAPVCVGLDPVYDRLPAEIRAAYGGPGAPHPEQAVGGIESFCQQVIELVAPLAPAVKINSAFFERYHQYGSACYYRVVAAAQSAGLVVIGDVKRGDIGHSSLQYAIAHLGDNEDEIAYAATADAVTVSPYLGIDGVAPFIEVATGTGKGVFVLVQTSNASARQLQGLLLQEGGTIGEHVARLVDGWASDTGLVGASGYSAVGAVVAPDETASAGALRKVMPRCIFLVPGFGAQGRTADQVAACFDENGRGAIVNASRSVIFAHDDKSYAARFGDDWRRCIEASCRDFCDVVGNIAKKR